MSTDLAVRATARDLAAAFAIAEKQIREHFARLVEIERTLNLAFLGTTHGGRMRLEDRWGHGTNFAEPDDTIKRLQRDAWRAIVDRLELRKVMSVKRWQELEKQLDREELPAITEESVYEFARAQRADIQGNLVDTIVEVYEWLRPRSSWGDYKTNGKTSFMEIGEKVILESCVRRKFIGPGFEVDHYREDRVDALDRIFLILDGRAGLAQVHHHGALHHAIHASTTGHVETDYFEVRCHKKGTMHLRFKRVDLLAKLNKIAAGKTLRVADVAA